MSMKATLTPGLQLLLAAVVMLPEITMRLARGTASKHAQMQNARKRRQLWAIVAPQITTIVHNCALLQLLRNVRCNDVRALRIIFATVFGKGSKRE